MKRKYLALLMVLALVLCLFPVTALAAPGVRIAAARTLPKTDAEAAPAAESGDEPEDPAAADEPAEALSQPAGDGDEPIPPKDLTPDALAAAAALAAQIEPDSEARTGAVPGPENNSVVVGPNGTTASVEGEEPVVVSAGESVYAYEGTTVYNNGGTVYNNGGIVYNNAGTVYANGGTVYNNAGIVYANDGTIYNNVSKGPTEPENPVNGQIWIDTASGTVKEFAVYTRIWVVVETVYTRVDFTTSGQVKSVFKEHDGVNITGMHEDESSDLNGCKILYAVGEENNHDFIVIIGIQEESFSEEAEIRISRDVPDMDFVCEAQNRLWGCFYGNLGPGKGNINEIYCCALGDFKNWEQYLGVSTDSWRASRGSDGPWTGCINYLGSPTFFKENIIHTVSVSPVGAHQIGDLPARGVQQGSHGSLAVVNETLYYKARSGIVAYQGGIPADVGQALGEEKYYNAVAGAFGDRYYISMKDTHEAWHLFCYDVKKGIWMREDNLHAEGFAPLGDELYAKVGNSILALNGTDGAQEETVEWWEFQQEVRLPVTGTAMIPVRPRRCDHLRMRLEGSGDVRIFSIARILELGSDA